jgi:hypothetical protein
MPIEYIPHVIDSKHIEENPMRVLINRVSKLKKLQDKKNNMR